MLRAVIGGSMWGIPRATVIGLLLTVGPSATDALASKKPRQPTRSDLATVWVGGEPEEPLEYFRLELDANGTGILTVQYLPGKPAVAYRVLATSLSGYAVKLDLDPVDDGAQPLQVRGDAVPGLMRLQVAGRAPDWTRHIQLQRYDQLLERIRAVTERAEAHTRATR